MKAQHKLQRSISFDVVSRYDNLFRFYKKVGFDDEARWLANCLEWAVGAEEARRMIEQKTAD